MGSQSGGQTESQWETRLKAVRDSLFGRSQEELDKLVVTPDEVAVSPDKLVSKRRPGLNTASCRWVDQRQVSAGGSCS